MSGNALKAGWLWDDLRLASERVKTFDAARNIQRPQSPPPDVQLSDADGVKNQIEPAPLTNAE